jgi:hypothetical protein
MNVCDFNIAGYGDESDSSQSKAYSLGARSGTMRFAMLDWFKEPGVWGDVVDVFFRLKKERIVLQLKEWKNGYLGTNTVVDVLIARLKELELE